MGKIHCACGILCLIVACTGCGCFQNSGPGLGLFRANNYGTVYAPPAYATAPQYAATVPTAAATAPVLAAQPAAQAPIVLAQPPIAAAAATPQVIYLQPGATYGGAVPTTVTPASYYQTSSNACGGCNNCNPCACQCQ